MENLKGCGVDRNTSNYDRSIESYDYAFKYRMNGQKSLKRRQSHSDDSEAQFDTFDTKNKRFRANSMGSGQNRKNVRLRLGHRSDDSSSNDGATTMNASRSILDLNVTADSTNEDVAREIANKLYEEKDELLCN